MVLNTRHRGGIVAALAFGTLAACGDKQVVQKGECRPVNGADVCAFSTTMNGELASFGAMVPIKAIENAPANPPMVWPPVMAAGIPLPEDVRTKLGFNVLTVFWEAGGHPPAAFFTPHFDFHMNTATLDELKAIDCVDLAKPTALPAGYGLIDVAAPPPMGNLVGLCVAGMGMHALPSSTITDTAVFQKAMVVGYWKQKPIFAEPMLARATLLERRSFELNIPDVAGVAANVHYPTKFIAAYDSTAQAYKFEFTNWGKPGPK